MISETGRYWATGIVLTWTNRAGSRRNVPYPGWGAMVDFRDGGFCNDDPDTASVSTEGVLRTRYAVGDGQLVDGLTAVIDTILSDAATLGIEWTGPPWLYYRGDGEDEEHPPPPGWLDLLTQQAQRIGGRTYDHEPEGTPS